MSANPVVSYAPSPAPVPDPSPLRQVFSSGRFLIAVAVLALAAVGLNAGTRAMQLHFKKLPVPLRHKLDDARSGVPTKLGGWVMIHEQSTLDPDVQHSLGTKEFVFRTYVNANVIGEEDAAKLAEDVADDDPARGRKLRERHDLMQKIQREHPEAVMWMNVTYYTGMVDTVAHVPDRCMVADGYEPKVTKLVNLTAGPAGGAPARDIQARFATFEDQTGTGRVSRNVAYFFHCNGEFDPSPVGVRGRLQNLFERHGYYAKVEFMTDEPARAVASESDRRTVEARSVAAMSDLLTAALPEIERCLPDWPALKQAEAAKRKQRSFEIADLKSQI